MSCYTLRAHNFRFWASMAGCDARVEQGFEQHAASLRNGLRVQAQTHPARDDRAALPPHCKRSATQQRTRQTPHKSANCDRARYTLADRLAGVLARNEFTDEDRAFIEPRLRSWTRP